MKTTENERLDYLLSVWKSHKPQPDIDAWLAEDESEAYDRIMVMRVRRRRIVRWVAAAVLVGIVVTIGLRWTEDEHPAFRPVVQKGLAVKPQAMEPEVAKFPKDFKNPNDLKVSVSRPMPAKTPIHQPKPPEPQSETSADLDRLLLDLDLMEQEALQQAVLMCNEAIMEGMAATQGT